MVECVWRDLGRMEYGAAVEVQRELVERRKRDEIADQLLFVEHPHVITLGRNGKPEHLLGGDGIAFYETDRGGDITYHGPGQLVGYPIMDLKEWKRANKIILEANPNFRDEKFPDSADPADKAIVAQMKGKKVPAIGRVDISIIEEDQSRLLAFDSGQIDYEKLPYTMTEWSRSEPSPSGVDFSRSTNFANSPTWCAFSLACPAMAAGRLP